MVPQSLQKPLKALEKRGNPYGKMEKKRADWALDKEFAAAYTIKDLAKDKADTLYFVDSITSYDDNIQEIARHTAVILQRAGVDFARKKKTAAMKCSVLEKRCCTRTSRSRIPGRYWHRV